MKGIWKTAGAVCALTAAAAAAAHHSYAMFDLTREATAHGTVKALEWTNPHVWLFIVGEEAEPKGVTYAFESVSPGELTRFYGWSKKSLSVGDKITVRYAPLRSGKPGGVMKIITLSSGKVLQTPAAKIPLFPPGGPPPGSGPPAVSPPGAAPPAKAVAGAPRPVAPHAAPASLAKLPDWSGMWIIHEELFIQALLSETRPGSPHGPPLTSAYAARLQALNERRMTGKDGPGGALRTNSEGCLPPGMPDMMRYPAGLEVLFTPGRVTLISEEGPTVRHIYTDGRGHSPDAEPTFNGESIGHWEGATLVVDTTAISARSQLIAAVHTSGRAHIVERLSLKDPTHLQIDTVVEDPIALHAPWRYTRVYERIDSTYREMICLENNREVGGGEPDLTPPPSTPPARP